MSTTISSRVQPGTEIAPASAHRAGISWGPVLAGATVATAVTILLVALGSGFGFAAVSPVSGDNPSAATFTVLAAIWLIIVQWVSSFFGGYLAGRLRSGWAGVHGDEVMFRDTACGLTAWAVASIVVVFAVASGVSSLAGNVGRAATAVASSAAGSVTQAAGAPSGYMLDTLFRPASPTPQAQAGDSKAQAGRILATAATGDISQPDHDYLVQLVANTTGAAPADAGKRVDAAIAQEKKAVADAKQVADTARKTASSFALYTGFSMLIGAFIASVGRRSGRPPKGTVSNPLAASGRHCSAD